MQPAARPVAGPRPDTSPDTHPRPHLYSLPPHPDSYLVFCTAYWTLTARSIVFIVQVGRVCVCVWWWVGGWGGRGGAMGIWGSPCALPAMLTSASRLARARQPQALPVWPCPLRPAVQSTAHSAVHLESRIEAFLPMVSRSLLDGLPLPWMFCPRLAFTHARTAWPLELRSV